jgi:DNA primase
MDDVDLIKQKIDIGDLIGSYIPVKRAGRNLKALCPFHNEKTPSFVVSPERQIWHCFSCGKGGDIFTFIEEYERLDFSESLRLLADKAGIKLKKTVFKSQLEEKKGIIYEINHLTSQYYHYLLLKHKSGKEALSYVTEKRGLSKALLETFSIGYAPGEGHALSSYLLKKKGYTKEELVEAGVATIRNNRLYDFFQNRVIFPILDSRGNIVAFSGRGLTDAAIPKYINTKETPVYIKGDTVFGLFQAKEAMKKEGKVLLMEGEFDVITSFKEGITNTVAVKGTALTENQIRLLKRYVQKIVFCFDTDPAGTEAQRRSISLIAHEGINAGVVIPPFGKDPDELLRENPSLFKKAIKEEVNIYDYIINTAAQNQNPETVEGKKHILTRTLPYFIGIENEIVKEHYFKKLGELINSSYESVVKEAEKLKNPPSKIEKPVMQTAKKPRQDLIEEHLLTLILQAENPKAATAVVSGCLLNVPLGSPVLQQIFDFLKKYFLTSETLNIAEISLMLPKELTQMFDLCLLTPLVPLPSSEAYLVELEKLAKDVRQLSLRERLKLLSDKIRTEEKNGDTSALTLLQEEFDSLMKYLK